MVNCLSKICKNVYRTKYFLGYILIFFKKVGGLRFVIFDFKHNADYVLFIIFVPQFCTNLIHNKKMETVIFKVFASVGADKPVIERILYPKSSEFLNYNQIIDSLHQLFGDGSVVVVSHEKVKK